jgi:hypothetical protein
MKNQWISILIVGLTFGTAWAIRGQFGHEQGAAWAAGIGAMGLVLVSGRKDWYRKMLLIALGSAIGWGAGGMISYGKVVGYGRSDDFLNAGYGLLMLLVIGGLFGLLGGGFVGLTLDSTKQKRVKWGQLIAEMTAGGIIFYYFLVVQLEWLMTPPRSEAWAVCLGAGTAMIWYMIRNNFQSPLRVAVISAIGAGFGFAFGNFLQIVGTILEIKFNMWNVMEYSIGFFSGISMSYAVFNSEWPEETSNPESWENKTGFLILFVFIPFLVFINSSLIENFLSHHSDIEATENIPVLASMTAVVMLIISAATGWLSFISTGLKPSRNTAIRMLMMYLGTYIVLSYIVTGAFNGVFLLNHHLYVVNFIVIFILLRKQYPLFRNISKVEINGNIWILIATGIVIIILILAFILINIHGDLGGANTRFETAKF